MHSAIKSQRMRNYAEQRITEYKRNLEAVLAKDPKVQEYKQKQKQQQQEVTQEVINNINRDSVKNRKKKRAVTILPSLDNQELQIEDREMPSHPLLNQSSQQKSYKLLKPLNAQLKTAMRMSFYDRAFQRDCM
jgi:hypothetical protein